MTLIGWLQSEFLDLSCLDLLFPPEGDVKWLFSFFFFFFFFFPFNLEMPIIGPVD